MVGDRGGAERGSHRPRPVVPRRLAELDRRRLQPDGAGSRSFDCSDAEDRRLNVGGSAGRARLVPSGTRAHFGFRLTFLF